VHQQDRKQGALPVAAQCEILAIPKRRQWPEDPELHGRGGLRAHRIDYQQSAAEVQHPS
jgi:hypothetical protein